MKNKKITKKDIKVMKKWIINHGACSFDYKNHDILLGDGGLFSIEKTKYMAHKVLGYKKLQNGNSEVIFSEKRTVPAERYDAVLWMEELDETISYLKSMKRMLNKLGVKTSKF